MDMEHSSSVQYSSTMSKSGRSLIILLLLRARLSFPFHPTALHSYRHNTGGRLGHISCSSQHQSVACTTTQIQINHTVKHQSNPSSPQDYEPTRQILKGKHKWLGGAISNDGCVYGIPSHSNHVICLEPNNNNNYNNYNSNNKTDFDSYTTHFLPLPSTFTPQNDKSHQFKWLRGIITNNTLYGIPAWYEGVLVVNIQRWKEWRRHHPNETVVRYDNDDNVQHQDFIKIIPLPQTEVQSNNNNHKKQRWMWHGAALNVNKTAIYCIPSNANEVLKVDLITHQTSYIPIPKQQEQKQDTIPTSLTNKWYGGILGHDNAIYGIPYASGSVLRMDANTDTISLLGDYGINRYNWHGGVLANNGNIYAFPAHAESVLRIDTTANVGSEDERLSTLPILRAAYDIDGIMKYKWLGGSLGVDGNVYGMPSDATSILRIDTITNEVTTFGQVETTNDAEGCPLPEKNKWQGGVLAHDGHIYAVPSNACGILRIDSRPESQTSIHKHDPSRIDVIGELPNTKDKWQGGFLVENGSIYGIPENCDGILEVKPPKKASEDVIVRIM